MVHCRGRRKAQPSVTSMMLLYSIFFVFSSLRMAQSFTTTSLSSRQRHGQFLFQHQRLKSMRRENRFASITVISSVANDSSSQGSDEQTVSDDAPTGPLKPSSERLKWKRVLAPNDSPQTESSAESDDSESMSRKDLILMSSSTILAGLVFAWLVAASGPGGWRYYLAGGICAATSHAIPVPIDVIKTKKQVDPNLYKLNFFEATRAVVNEDGVRVLLAGLGPTFVGYMMEGAVKFGVYEVLKPPVAAFTQMVAALTPATAFMNSHVFSFMICAGISGLAASVMLCPMEALRIRLVAEPDFAPQGWITGGMKLFKKEGFAGLWKGLNPMILKQVPYTVTKNVSFDLLTRSAYAAAIGQGLHLGSRMKLIVPFTAAVLASLLSCVSSQPGDMLLSLVNAHGGSRRTRDILRDIRRSKRGLRGFFVGFETRVLHVGIIVTLQLLIYDFVKRLCGIAATGSV